MVVRWKKEGVKFIQRRKEEGVRLLQCFVCSLLSVFCSCLRPLAERPPVVVALLLQLGPLPEYEGGQRTVVEWRSPEYLTKLGSGYLPQRKSLMGGILLNSVEKVISLILIIS